MSCKITCSHPNIVFVDGKSRSKMCFENPNKRIVTKIRVDDCLIKSGRRCDFLLIDHNGIEHFIELKGKQVEYACEQIIATIKIICSNIKNPRHSFVVSSACPLTSTEVQVYKSKFRKNYNSSLKIQTRKCSYKIE